MIVVGLSAGFHDSAAAVVEDGRILAAVEQERITRIKHDASFPFQALESALQCAEVDLADVDLVAYHEKPIAAVDRHVQSRLHAGPRGLGAFFAETPNVLRRQLLVPRNIEKTFRSARLRVPPVRYCEHHISHLAAAYYPSPFETAAVLAVDGVGEWASTSIGEGHGPRLDGRSEIRFPDSIGLLYTAFATYCGFRANSGEGELMGLAPFGEPRFADRIREHLVRSNADGSFQLDPRYFAYQAGRRMTSRRFHRLFGGPPAPLGTRPTQREADLAASVQIVLEELLVGLAIAARADTGWRQLCLAGGVALNCVANRRLAESGIFDEVWVQPAAGDAGSALGAALWFTFNELGVHRQTSDDAMHGSFLGPSYSPTEIERWLDLEGIPHQVIADPVERCRQTAKRLANGDVVGWFSGRMEFGPRALGHRSILADARSESAQGRVNRLIKERAPFRPFAPAVLADRVAEWFDSATTESPFMTFTAPVAEQRRRPVHPHSEIEARVAQARSEIPSVTHVDHSARLQTVDPGRNPEFHRLLEAFDRETGCPILLNTSFNARDEPIVCTPSDALNTFRRTGLDLLVMETCMIEQRHLH